MLHDSESVDHININSRKCPALQFISNECLVSFIYCHIDYTCHYVFFLIRGLPLPLIKNDYSKIRQNLKPKFPNPGKPRRKKGNAYAHTKKISIIIIKQRRKGSTIQPSGHNHAVQMDNIRVRFTLRRGEGDPIINRGVCKQVINLLNLLVVYLCERPA